MSDEQEKSQLVSTWGDVEQVIKQNAFPKWAGRALGIVVAMVVVLAGFAFWNVNRINDLVTQNHTLVQQVKAGAVSSCMAGNRARATNVLIWDGFLTLLVNDPSAAAKKTGLISSIEALNLPPAEVKAFSLLVNSIYTPNPQDAQLTKQFEAYIAKNEAPQNCTKVYSGNAPSARALRMPPRG